MDENQYELAQEVTELRIQNEIKRIIAKPDRVSAMQCESCGEDIPEKRRELVPGVSLCVNCQSLSELRTKHYR